MDAAVETLVAAEQYTLPAAEKDAALIAGLTELTGLHVDRCEPYARMLAAWDASGTQAREAGDHPLAVVPYLPATVFKSNDLRSVHADDVYRVITSSGTSSQVPSRIYLDLDTAKLQTRALSSIVTHYLGQTRRPMLIIDHPGVLHDRKRYSARAAGILGMTRFGRDHLYALDDEMSLRREELGRWLSDHEGEDLLVFGFTFMVWHDFMLPLQGDGVDLSRATLIHSGGWKKMLDQAVPRSRFRSVLERSFGLRDVHDFYGMAEQVGSVCFECEEGYFHPPNFADVIIRDETDWKPSAVGSPGVVEVVSLLPRSYPGHAILTEDLGVIDGVDDCRCGRMGRRFHILGRVPKAEIRGCSDTLAAH